MLVCTNDAIATIEENFKIRTFISNLEEMGLEFETEEGQVRNIILQKLSIMPLSWINKGVSTATPDCWDSKMFHQK